MQKGISTGLTHVQCKKFLDFGTTAGKVFFRRCLLFLSILFFPIFLPFDPRLCLPNPRRGGMCRISHHPFKVGHTLIKRSGILRNKKEISTWYIYQWALFLAASWMENCQRERSTLIDYGLEWDDKDQSPLYTQNRKSLSGVNDWRDSASTTKDFGKTVAAFRGGGKLRSESSHIIAVGKEPRASLTRRGSLNC